MISEKIYSIQKEISNFNYEGWLLYNFRETNIFMQSC